MKGDDMWYEKDEDINQALIQLNDAICSFERSTGITFALILKDNMGFVHRSADGKPSDVTDITDQEFIDNVTFSR